MYLYLTFVLVKEWSISILYHKPQDISSIEIEWYYGCRLILQLFGLKFCQPDSTLASGIRLNYGKLELESDLLKYCLTFESLTNIKYPIYHTCNTCITLIVGSVQKKSGVGWESDFGIHSF